MTGGRRGVDWSTYNTSQVGRDPRPLCLDVIVRAGAGRGRTALDLGAGAGIETRALLEAGWEVVAVDTDPALADRLAGGPHAEHLTTQVAALESIELPQADLVHAGYALPFVRPPHFERFWRGLRGSLCPGTWLAVDLFGDRDSWAPDPDLTTHTRAEVEALLGGLEVVTLDEEERDGAAFSGPKHWHVFHVIARQRST